VKEDLSVDCIVWSLEMVVLRGSLEGIVLRGSLEITL
jgi:hypothetical protein